MTKIEKQRRDVLLDSVLPQMAKLQREITKHKKEYEELKQKVFPLVEAAGDLYEVDGIKAQIIRGQSWQVDAVKLLNKFGEKAHSLITVSGSKFRKAFEAGLLGSKTKLKGIARLVDDKDPKFRLSQK